MGRTDQVPTTYPRLASLIGFIPADRVIACSDAVMAVQRDYGDRKERLYARFKYTVDAKGRSEEHTSELQSLMRISYAVFCLKKKQQLKRQSTVLSHQKRPHSSTVIK